MRIGVCVAGETPAATAAAPAEGLAAAVAPLSYLQQLKLSMALWRRAMCSSGWWLPMALFWMGTTAIVRRSEQRERKRRSSAVATKKDTEGGSCV